MREYQCKCGKSTAYGSMGQGACDGCSECGTQLMPVGYPGEFPLSEPHDWRKKYHEDTGIPYRRCARCGKREEEVSA